MTKKEIRQFEELLLKVFIHKKLALKETKPVLKALGMKIFVVPIKNNRRKDEV